MRAKHEGRKLRGRLIRLVLRRWPAVLIGGVVAAPAVWLLLTDYSWENAYTEGLSFVCGATGAALVLAGISGRKPDWVDPESDA